eukprot:4680769-Pyramimonas_sp.AAC.1
MLEGCDTAISGAPAAGLLQGSHCSRVDLGVAQRRTPTRAAPALLRGGVLRLRRRRGRGGGAGGGGGA